MTKKQKKNLIRIIISAVLMVILHFLPVTGLLRFLCYLIPYLIVGYDILIKAGKGIINRQPFDECLLMAIATIGAMAIAVYEDGDYSEGIAVMLFYQVGEWFQSYALGKSRRNISELMDIRPDYANVQRGETIEQVDPDEVEIGSTIVVQPGEKIPIDGIVLSGESSLDTSALTGESLPRSVGAGAEVISGCINLSGVLEIRTTKEFGESTASKILELVENASSRKSRSEAFISRFARIYTPAVVFSALALAFLPPIIRMTLLGAQPEFGTWIYRALTFLVISCPCALVISIPLTFFAGIGGAGRQGVLVKGSNYLEALSKTKYVVFDKTGTLTCGTFEVTGIYPSDEEQRDGMENLTKDQRDLLQMAAMAECASSHPIAKSLQKAWGQEIDRRWVDRIEEISGHGVSAYVNGAHILAGNDKLMYKEGIVMNMPGKRKGQTQDAALEADAGKKAKQQAAKDDAAMAGTVVHVAEDGVYRGYILISDKIRENAPRAIKALHGIGIKKTVMLTGDEMRAAQKVADTLGISEFSARLLPADKVKRVEELLENKAEKEMLVFVGDGINDAPVLSRADIGIAMGGLGSDAAIEAADVVLMDDDPMGLVRAIKMSVSCMRIVYENIWFAIGVKLICLLLGALGIANMWLAIFADVGVMVLAVLNAMRALISVRSV
ncbi:MAG: heavy metal translocating P-type ATPase [Lachnospiraceae bacterium]|nr:heavy metal translocating P-type ATPase [Lachnospiraceae bacterium]